MACTKSLGLILGGVCVVGVAISKVSNASVSNLSDQLYSDSLYMERSSAEIPTSFESSGRANSEAQYAKLSRTDTEKSATLGDAIESLDDLEEAPAPAKKSTKRRQKRRNRN